MRVSLRREKDLAGTWKEVNSGLEKKTCWPEAFGGNLMAGDQFLER